MYALMITNILTIIIKQNYPGCGSLIKKFVAP
jgi:hypothetical protein